MVGEFGTGAFVDLHRDYLSHDNSTRSHFTSTGGGEVTERILKTSMRWSLVFEVKATSTVLARYFDHREFYWVHAHLGVRDLAAPLNLHTNTS